ncbi:MAG: hypothetical protein IKL55_03600 [Clostridia bacterium]|nr:hypothetical protein [Clostridia bacterium]
MKKINSNIKKIRKLIIILGILAIAGIVCMLILMNDPVQKRLNFIYNEKIGDTSEKSPINAYALFTEYDGRVDTATAYKAMHIFVDDIVEEYYLKIKEYNFDKAKTEQYYEKNAEDIKKELGVEDKEKFVQFIDNLKVLKGNELILEKYTIVPESVRKLASYTEFALLIKYKDNEQIAYNLQLLNRPDITKSPIKYSAGVDARYLEYEYKNLTPVKDGTTVRSTTDFVYEKPGKVIK